MKSKIKVSIIIPFLNEELYLPKALKSLANQSYQNFELILVDNGSTDKSLEIIKKFKKKFQKIIIIKEKSKLLGQIRQSGFLKASGDILISADADNFFPRNWLAKIINYFKNNPSWIAIGGPYRFYDEDITIKRARKLVTPIFLFIDKILSGGGHHFAASNFAVRRKYFYEIGGFNTKLKFGEDIDLSYRLKKLGEIKFLNSLEVLTSARSYKGGIIKGIIKGALINFCLYLKTIFTIKIQWFLKNKKIKKFSLIRFIFSLVLFIFLILTGFNYYFKIKKPISAFEKEIALTFDDGPNKSCTPKVLEILDRYQIKATFFLIGKNVEKNPDLAKEIKKRGHLIGNHSYSHPFIITNNYSKINSEIKKTQEIIKNITGENPYFFRPPHGIMVFWQDEAIKEGLKPVQWTIIAQDWQDKKNAEAILKKIISKAHNKDIIVLHDGCDIKDDCSLHCQKIVKILPSLIEKLKQEGFRFVTINDLFQ